MHPLPVPTIFLRMLPHGSPSHRNVAANPNPDSCRSIHGLPTLSDTSSNLEPNHSPNPPQILGMDVRARSLEEGSGKGEGVSTLLASRHFGRMISQSEPTHPDIRRPFNVRSQLETCVPNHSSRSRPTPSPQNKCGTFACLSSSLFAGDRTLDRGNGSPLNKKSWGKNEERMGVRFRGRQAGNAERGNGKTPKPGLPS